MYRQAGEDSTIAPNELVRILKEGIVTYWPTTMAFAWSDWVHKWSHLIKVVDIRATHRSRKAWNHSTATLNDCKLRAILYIIKDLNKKQTGIFRHFKNIFTFKIHIFGCCFVTTLITLHRNVQSVYSSAIYY